LLEYAPYAHSPAAAHAFAYVANAPVYVVGVPVYVPIADLPFSTTPDVETYFENVLVEYVTVEQVYVVGGTAQEDWMTSTVPGFVPEGWATVVVRVPEAVPEFMVTVL